MKDALKENRRNQQEIPGEKHMKLRTLILAIGLVASVAAQQQQSINGCQEDNNALNTIAYINQMNYAYVVMKTYHNPLAVQEQLETIALEKIDLTSIPDFKTKEGTSIKELIIDMQNKLRELAVADKDYEYYKECQEDARRAAKKKLWFDIAVSLPKALASAGEVVTKGAGTSDGYNVSFQAICALAGDLIGGPVKSVYDYQSELERMRMANKEHEFKYEQSKEDTVFRANQMLLVAEVDFKNHFKLESSVIITPDEFQSLIDVLKLGNQSKIYPVLDTPFMRKRFDVFAPYWYYLALSAVRTEHYDVAVEASEMFFKKHRGLMKVDPMVAQAAVVEATALVGQKCQDKLKIECLLNKICDINFANANSDQSYFCATVMYQYLGKREQALGIINASQSRLDGLLGQRLITYRNLYKKDKDQDEEKWREVPNDMDLVRARTLYGAILRFDNEGNDTLLERLMPIVKEQTASSMEKFYYMGQVRECDLWNEAKKDVMAIGLWHFDETFSRNYFWVEAPVAWFLLGEINPTLSLMHGSNLVQRIDETFEKRQLRPSKTGVGADVVSIAFRCKNDLNGIDSVILDFPHTNWPVKIVFRPTKGFDISKGKGGRYPTTFLPSEVEFMGQKKSSLTPSISLTDDHFKTVKRKKYTDFLCEFKQGEILCPGNSNLTLRVDGDRNLFVAYTNSSSEKVSMNFDLRYFTKFGAQLSHVESDMDYFPGDRRECEMEMPAEMKGCELPASICFQYRLED